MAYIWSQQDTGNHRDDNPNQQAAAPVISEPGNLHRNFVPHLSHNMEPLRQMLKKEA